MRFVDVPLTLGLLQKRAVANVSSWNLSARDHINEVSKQTIIIYHVQIMSIVFKLCYNAPVFSIFGLVQRASAPLPNSFRIIKSSNMFPSNIHISSKDASRCLKVREGSFAVKASVSYLAFTNNTSCRCRGVPSASKAV